MKISLYKFLCPSSIQLRHVLSHLLDWFSISASASIICSVLVHVYIWTKTSKLRVGDDSLVKDATMKDIQGKLTT